MIVLALMDVCVCVHAVFWANNAMDPWQINFLQRYKRPSLDVLLKHMPEVEAMQFLDDVVDVYQLERKLKQKFPADGNTVVEEVRLCESVCVCAFAGTMGRGHLSILWENTDSLHTRYTVVAPVQCSGVHSVSFLHTSKKKV